MPSEPMRLIAMEVVTKNLPFRWRFQHAGADRGHNETLFVALKTNHGSIGYGECIPRPYLTGETMQSCSSNLQHKFWPKLQKLTFSQDIRPDEVLKSLYEEADTQRELAAYGALDIAVFDAWARHFAIPTECMLRGASSGRDHGFPLTAPIDLKMPLRLAATVYRALGFDRVKIKVTRELEYARLDLVRRILGPRVQIIVDANGAFTLGEIRPHLSQLMDLGITALEEPLKGLPLTADLTLTQALARLQKESRIPIMADESLCSQADAESLTQAGGVHLWNLRLAKNGGFTGVLTLAAKAQWLGVAYQLGALVGESSLMGQATATLLTVLQPRFVESSFAPLFLTADPFSSGPMPGPRLKYATGGVGLGVEPRRWLFSSEAKNLK
jgi:L-alanine-DL-glutamate epimerase-like enolase superfamily enzyme